MSLQRLCPFIAPPQQRTVPHWRGGALCFCALKPHTRVGSFSAGSLGPSWTEPRALLGIKGCRGQCSTLERASQCDGHPKPRASPVPCLKSIPARLRWRGLQALSFMRTYWALHAVCSCQGRGAPPSSVGMGFQLRFSPKLSCLGKTDCSDPECRPTHPCLYPFVHPSTLGAYF